MNLAPILPDPAMVALRAVTLTPEQVTLVLAATPTTSACPRCGQASDRVHSHYTRHLADLPWLGLPARIDLQVRRFFCANGDCTRCIFTERLPQVAASYARKTCRLQGALELLALALGGQAGSRVAQELAMATSPDTLLRLTRRLPLPTGDTPEVVGMDDWALRKGMHYGTILCDLERRQVLDLLPDYTVESLRAWLAQHPQVRTLARDRGSILIQAAQAGAPQARQVADRFHLLKNLHEALVRCLDRHGKDLQQAAVQANQKLAAAAPPLPLAPPALPPPPPCRHLVPMTADQKASAASRATRLEHYQQVIEQHRQGLTQRAIARRLGLDRSTVRRYLRAGRFPERAQRHYQRKIDPYATYLRQRWDQGCHNAAQLTRELAGRGYTGSREAVKRAVSSWRERAVPSSPGAPTGTPPRAPVPPCPSATRVAWLLVKAQDKREPEEQVLVEAVMAQSPEIATATEQVRAFADVVGKKDVAALNAWMAQVREPGMPPELGAFAEGLEQDLPAVTAALELPWSSGQVEGQINRLKTIKRQMYGRANFDLLRRRVLLAA